MIASNYNLIIIINYVIKSESARLYLRFRISSWDHPGVKPADKSKLLTNNLILGITFDVDHDSGLRTGCYQQDLSRCRKRHNLSHLGVHHTRRKANERTAHTGTTGKAKWWSFRAGCAAAGSVARRRGGSRRKSVGGSGETVGICCGDHRTVLRCDDSTTLRSPLHSMPDVLLGGHCHPW